MGKKDTGIKCSNLKDCCVTNSEDVPLNRVD